MHSIRGTSSVGIRESSSRKQRIRSGTKNLKFRQEELNDDISEVTNNRERETDDQESLYEP
jgi:hypothetical protein